MLLSNKYFIGSLVVLLAIAIAYVKGRNDMQNSYVKKEYQQAQKQIIKYEHSRIETEKVENKIKSVLQKNPKDDKRDSCLLSNNPFSKDCL